MIGITIGVGNEWEQIANWAATRMTQNTGLRCEVINELSHGVCHASWLKCHLLQMFPDHDEFLVFDADIIPVKHWNPRELFKSMNRAFCAVPDRNWSATWNECRNFDLPYPDFYINGGLLIFGREHGPIWESVWKRHPKFGSWMEQTALNAALMNCGMEVCRLPRDFNRLLHGITPIQRTEAINLHAAGLPDRSMEMMKALYDRTYCQPDTERSARQLAQA